MASLLLVFAAVLLALLSASTAEAVRGDDNCTSAIMSLAPCLDFTTGSSNQPSAMCCTQLAAVVKSEPQCLCAMVGGGGGTAQFGFKINQTLAMQLPAACKVQTPPASQCKTATTASSAPQATPSPPPKAPKAEGGSKSTASTDGSKTNGGERTASSVVSFMFFATLVASVL